MLQWPFDLNACFLFAHAVGLMYASFFVALRSAQDTSMNVNNNKKG